MQYSKLCPQMRVFNTLMTTSGGFNLGLQKVVGIKHCDFRKMKPIRPRKYTFNYSCSFHAYLLAQDFRKQVQLKNNVVSKMIEGYIEHCGVTKKGAPAKLRKPLRGCYASLPRKVGTWSELDRGIRGGDKKNEFYVRVTNEARKSTLK